MTSVLPPAKSVSSNVSSIELLGTLPSRDRTLPYSSVLRSIVKFAISLNRFTREVSMEHASSAAARSRPTDRGRFSVRIMGKSLTASETRMSENSSEHIAARSQTSPDSTLSRPDLGVTTYTLRIKPDRRCSQMAIDPSTDRRRPR